MPAMNATQPNKACSGSMLGLLMRQVRHGICARMEDELSKVGHDLTFSQCIVIGKLTAGIASASELARAAELNPGAMTRLLDKLEAKGLIVRIADPADRRALRINLTQAGFAAWREIDRCGMRVSERALSGMDEVDRKRLIRMLEQVRDKLSPLGD